MTKVTSNEEQTENNRDFAARLMAVQAYYQISQNQQPLRTILNEYLDHRKEIPSVEGPSMGKPNSTLFKQILVNLDERLAEVDEIMRGHLKPGVEKDVEPLLKAILFCGISELLSHQNISKSLIINDYLNVTHSFYSPNQVSFVNGILDAVAKLLRS